MPAPQLDHRKGLIITGIGGLFLTFDIPLIKLADGNSWSILMVRSITTFTAALVIWGIWSLVSGKARPLVPSRAGYLVGLLYGLSSIAFLSGVFLTSTANLVFILAFNPMFAALLSWIFLGERPKPVTLVAMFFMLVGVAIIVSEGISSGNWIGDMVAVVAAFLMACAITISRSTGEDMGLTAILSTCIPFVVAGSMVLTHSGYAIADPKWILLDGAIMMPIAFLCLATGPKYISGPEVGMFYLLETILAPIWVWIIFYETPSRQSLVGGLILIVTLVVHSLWQLRDAHRARTNLPRYPL
ncbi:EamA/RhaT family transporter [Phyllobacterium phragmitis]|uniref:EamA/RhaT family transporter n=1 Tax=Phyllobacterium phragmitis TaxID=2670329 RepID=A0A2S9IZJ9_9HYPH|nr:DMT family transporter [Phyllobacterium phragmitis]PRD45953.1 EamA/RhaT family transporter [Phyllobacterium phragmitis]